MKLKKLFVAASIAMMLSCSDTNAVAETLKESTSDVFSHVINPEVPTEMQFAGQTIYFDRDDMYERMDRELTSMIYTHGTTLLLIKRANKYFPIMAPILKKHVVPMDFL